MKLYYACFECDRNAPCILSGLTGKEESPNLCPLDDNSGLYAPLWKEFESIDAINCISEQRNQPPEMDKQLNELQEQIDCYKKLIKLEHGLEYRLGKSNVVNSEKTSITLRDYFAGQALAGLTASIKYQPTTDPEEIINLSYELADKMIKHEYKEIN